MANDSILELRLKNRKVPMDSFAATWAISLMSHSVPLEYSEMLWEHLFKSGWDGFKIIIDTILHVLKPELSQYCKFIKSSTKTTIICSNLSEMTIVLGRLNKPPRSREYALEFEIDENSCECFRLWEAIKIRLLEE
uniref:Rab-GAP TBC domain-containing protein n=1 Tax=Euplotes crassus TaxID=5936 RepID=A0A7S3KTR0_EUPCR|mmetsp:Transcript_8138/g.7718  ORF Transcript_8138/g.7718 Transcript_8138/m.7718 type:complete len:136 (+) Transcript_8138:231-638(+)